MTDCHRDLPILRALVTLPFLLAPGQALAKNRVAASIPDLASIAASVGGSAIEVFSIAKSGSNPHSVEVLPSYMVKVSRVGLYLKVGLGLDAWADAIIDGARNPSLQVLDCSSGIEALEKPAGKADASLGDVHPQGNPHYWLDPSNGGILADRIAEALGKIDPSHASLFAANAAAFKIENAKKVAAWKAELAGIRGAPIFTYHSSWAYFADAFGLRIIGKVEPFPGIPPTAKHLQGLADLAKSEKVSILIQEPYFRDKDARFLERRSGLRIFRFAPSCDGAGPGEYWKHFDAMVTALAKGN